MKYTRFAILSGVLVSVLVFGCMFAAAQAGWKIITPKTVFNEKLRVAAFEDSNFGVTGGAGDIGKARYTTDGGKTWKQVDSSGG
jgi:hypothetical protein